MNLEFSFLIITPFSFVDMLYPAFSLGKVHRILQFVDKPLLRQHKEDFDHLFCT